SIATISNDSWWSSQPSANIVTRIFPAAGYISSAYVSGSGTLYYRGDGGYYASGSEFGGSYAWSAYFDSSYARADYRYYKGGGFAVRLFASE
ncbi:hypothetical protein ACMYZ8_12455, partial [Bacteroides sp. KG156]